MHSVRFFDHRPCFVNNRLTRMETTKVRSNSKTVSVLMLQSLFIFVCFLVLIHVELEMHAHREILRVFTSQHSGENLVSRNIASDETSQTTFTVTHNDLAKGVYMSSTQCYY